MMFHIRLKELRTEQNVTQATVSKQLDYGTTAITNYESGRNEPCIQDLIRLSKYFNVTVDYLIGASDIKRRKYRFNDNIILFLNFYFQSNEKIRQSLDTMLQEIIKIYQCCQKIK